MRRVIRAAVRVGVRVMGAAALAAAVLAGCTPKASAPQPGLRDPAVMISSAALFDPARFGGGWRVVASATPGCGGARQDWRWDGRGGYALSGIDCAGRQPAVLEGRAVLSGPGGRLTPSGGYGDAPIWVLWVDQDYRVAVLGTPGGQWALVLSRQSPARPDLMQAAREVLDFNGYDLSRIGG